MSRIVLKIDNNNLSSRIEERFLRRQFGGRGSIAERVKRKIRTHRKFNPSRVIFLLSILTSMLASFVLEGTSGRKGDVDDSSSSRTAENPIVFTVSGETVDEDKRKGERERVARF